jgi:hypothetical protein
MPRHPPCALKNLPHDHRTHRPTTTTTGPLPRGKDPLPAALGGDQSRTQAPQPPPRRPKTTPATAAAPVLKMLASTIQFSNNNPHTPHSRAGATTIRPSPPPAGRREPKTQHHPPRTHHPSTTAPARGPAAQEPVRPGRGLLSQDPTVRHGPLLHRYVPHRSTTTTTTGTTRKPAVSGY